MRLMVTQSGAKIVPTIMPHGVTDMRSFTPVAVTMSEMLASNGAYTVRRITPHGVRTVMNTMLRGVRNV